MVHWHIEDMISFILPAPSLSQAGTNSMNQARLSLSTIPRRTATLCTMSQQRPTLRGVVFDMDGTLTVPNIDFQAMYSRCGVDPSQDLLKVLPTLSPESAAEKMAIINDIEAEATKTMTLMPGAKEVATWLDSHGIKTALVTRNTLVSATALASHLPSFDIIIARDHGDQPPKPDPAALLHIASTWRVQPNELVMVGDSPANDIAFGNVGGAATALVGSRRAHVEAGARKSGAVPDFAVEHLHSLPQELWKAFHIPGETLGTAAPPMKVATPVAGSRATRAAVEGDVRALEALGEDEWNAPDESGNTPLVWAADSGQRRVVEFLVRNGVDLNVRGYFGATAVSRAANRGRSEVLKLLVEAGADKDIANDKMQYPLHFAAYKQKMEAVEILLASGVGLRSLDRKGRVPAQDTSNDKIRERILNAM